MFLFLFQVFLISLTGVMAPGPVTASAIAMGIQRRSAGLFIAVGHGVVELPLVIILMLGAGKFLQSPDWQMVIGFVGGAFLIFLAVQMSLQIKTVATEQQKTKSDQPFIAGVMLSAGNPYFILWWIFVGLNLAKDAKELGPWALMLFGAIHWLCDLIWLWFLSYASFRGARVFGPKVQKWVLVVCAAALVAFAAKFIFDSAKIFF